MVLPEADRSYLEQIVVHLEGLFRENITVPELRQRFFLYRQQEDESLTHFVVAL